MYYAVDYLDNISCPIQPIQLIFFCFNAKRLIVSEMMEVGQYLHTRLQLFSYINPFQTPH